MPTKAQKQDRTINQKFGNFKDLLDRGSIRSSQRFGLSTGLFLQVLFYIVDMVPKSIFALQFAM